MRTRRLPLPTLALLLLATVTAGRPQAAGELERLLAEAPRDHPRLFLGDAGLETLRSRIDAEPALAGVRARVEADAEAILAVEPVERVMTGRRLLSVSRTVLKRVTYLALLHRLSGDERFLRRAQQEMLAAAAFADWNPSHFLDVAEMTAALAIGYDWLHDGLEPRARATIRDAIVDRGLRPSLEGGWWVTTTNNWNPVCHGGLAMGALAVLEDEPELTRRILERAIENAPAALHEYAPDGAYPEGPSYWEYGTTYSVLLIDALRSVLGDDFGLADHPGFLESADYVLHVIGPSGAYFNYSDCGERGGVAPAMYWFAARRGDPGLLWHERSALEELGTRKPDAGQGDRLLPFLLLWSPPLGGPDGRTVPAGLHFRADGATPVAMHRSGWDDRATFVAVKGGSASTNHAHMDAGSFVMEWGGVRWAIDLGAQNYDSLESRGIRLWDRGQDSERWTVFRLSTYAHGTLVVDGRQQGVEGSAPIVASVGSGAMPHTIVDLAPVYAGQLAAARRGVGLRPDGSVLVQDEVTALERATTVRWGLVTRAEVLLEGGSARLEQDGLRLALRVLSPAGAELRTWDTASPRAPHDHPNPGTRMVGFEVRLPASASERLSVLLAPGDFPDERPALAPLADW